MTRLGEVEVMRVNGLEAATGAIKVQGTNGPIELRLAAICTEPAHIYRFRFVTPLSLLAQLGRNQGKRQKGRHGHQASEADGV